jgi:16S rRNA processing protein RimM
MSDPAGYFIVGRVRRAHGIRGELAVELLTDAPDAYYAPGARLFAGTVDGDIAPGAPELHVVRSSPFKGGIILAVEEINDRTESELWRDRYLLVPDSEVQPLDEGEVYLHDLIGMQTRLASGEVVGEVVAFYELPQGVTLEIQRAREGKGPSTVLVPFSDVAVKEMDVESRTIVLDPPAGLLD